MPAPDDEVIGLLLERGLITPTQAAECDRMLALQDGPRSRVEALLALRIVTPEQLRELGLPLEGPRRAADPAAPPLPPGDTMLPIQADSDGTLAASAPTRPMESSRPPSPPPMRIGRFDVIGPIGQGGMGTVYRAWDPELRRVVAIKVLSGLAGASDAARARFEREARAVASLRHPRIVGVYEVGRSDDALYIAMEYIRGASLRVRLGEREPERDLLSWVRVILEIAEALGLAHARGIIHRDIKPENILIEEDGDPVLVDFGLVKEVWTDGQTAGTVSSESQITATGQILGTPSYMAPEQAGGEQDMVSPATDVYGLGAVLYEVMSGRPPFVGAGTWAILNQVLHEDPKPPSRERPSVPRELEVIALKCLEKEPSLRYPNGTELAADLGRFLRGEPILGRPVSRLGRCRRWARRNPLVASLSASLLLTVVVAAAIVWGGRVREQAARELAERQRHARIEEMVSYLAGGGDSYLQASLARRAIGDLAGCHALADKVREPIERLKEYAPHLPEPWLYEGRLLRQLERFEEAEHAFEEALKRAHAGAPIASRALYERGQLRARRYWVLLGQRRDQIMQAKGIGVCGVPGSWQPTREQIESAYPEAAQIRSQAIQDLSASLEGTIGAEDRATRDRAMLARGALDLLHGRLEEARGVLEAAAGENEWQSEPYETLARISESTGRWLEAIDWYRRARQVDRGRLDLLNALAYATHVGAALTGADGTALRGRALEALEDGCRMAPESVELWTWRGRLLAEEGEERRRRGGDAGGPYRDALSAYQEAERHGPLQADPLAGAASVHSMVAQWLDDFGRDPAPQYARAVEEYERAARCDSVSAIDLAKAGTTYSAFAECLLKRGKDPSALFEAAFERLGRAVTMESRNPVIAHDLATTHMRRAPWTRMQGLDPFTDWDRALACFHQALAVLPENGSVLYNLGALRKDRGLMRCSQGRDPEPEYQEAIRAYERALARQPGLPEVYFGIGSVRKLLGDWLSSQGKDPGEEYRKALASLESGAPAPSLRARFLCHMAQVHRALGDVAGRRGQDPTTEYDQAAGLYAQCLEDNPNLAEARNGQAGVDFDRGRRAASLGQDPSRYYLDAVRGFEEACNLDSSVLDAARNLALTHRSVAEWRIKSDADPSSALDAAIEVYRRLIDRGRASAEDLDQAGQTYRRRGDWRKTHGGDAAGDYEDAIEAYARALELDPARYGTWFNKGNACLALGGVRGDEREAEEKALECYDGCIAAHAGFAQAFFMKAQLHEKRGEREQALKAAEEAARLDPKNDAFRQLRDELRSR